MLNKSITNYHALEVKFYGPTTYKRARVKIKDHRFNRTKFISYDYSMNDIREMAINYLESLNSDFKVIGTMELTNSYMLVSVSKLSHTFIDILKKDK